MNGSSKKIHLTIDPDYYDTLKELADYQGIPLATMVKGMVDKQKPIVHALLKAFMEIEQGKDEQQILSELMAVGFESVAKEIRGE